MNVTHKFCRKKIESAIGSCVPVEDKYLNSGATGTLLDIDYKTCDNDMEVELSMPLSFLIKDKAVGKRVNHFILLQPKFSCMAHRDEKTLA